MTSISFDSMIEEEFSPFEILEMDIKGRLLTIINKKIMSNSWNQAEAAKALCVTQPRISNLKNLHHDKFSIEMLLRFIDLLGCEIKTDLSKGLTLIVTE